MARRRRETNAEIATTTPERRGNRTPDFLRPNEEPAAKVADAEQRSAAATSSDADTPTTTVTATATATKNGDAADDDLRDRLASLQTMVEQLVAAQVSPVATSGDPEVDSASRTLRFAQQTADSVIAEAREEALAIVADAERQRSEIIRRARQQADQDYTAERDRVVSASTSWQEQRAEVLGLLDAVTQAFATYRDGLTKLDETVVAVAGELRNGAAADDVVLHETSGNGAVFDVRPVAANADPFVFDVAELPETTGDFGWETDPVDGPDGATTF